MKCLYNGKLILGNKIHLNKALLFTDVIHAISDDTEINNKDYEYIDAKGAYISPGFIDVHIHGYDHADTMDGTKEALTTISKGIAANGVTSFLPTTMSMPMEAIKQSLDQIESLMKTQIDGAEILGAHMEGPFISKYFKGAQNEAFIISPSTTGVDFVKSYQHVIKLLTIGPEIDDALSFIKEISESTPITLSMGHSKATYQEALLGIQNGISHTTHLFNAMSGLYHREPGVVGAALTQNVNCELIADNIHVSPVLYSLIATLKSLDKLILITDCMSAGGCLPGEYTLGGQTVYVDQTSARLKDGTLAGSTLKLNTALKNFIHHTQLPLEKVINLVTINPAKAIHVDDHKGSLDIKKDADIVLFDQNLSILRTLCKGQTVYNVAP